MASSAFHAGHAEIASIETAWHTLTPLLGGAAAGLFLAALIASGVSSSVVGTMAGQMIMQGFVGFHIPVWARRLITMVPAFVVVACGRRCDTRAGVEPGRVEHRAAGADDRAGVVHLAQRSDGPLPEPSHDDDRGGARHSRRAALNLVLSAADRGHFSMAAVPRGLMARRSSRTFCIRRRDCCVHCSNESFGRTRLSCLDACLP